MKRFLLIILTSAALHFVACNKKDDQQKLKYFFTARKNDQPWVALAQAGYKMKNEKDTLLIHAMIGEEYMVIKLKPHGTGEYRLNEKDVNFIITVGGDVVASTYKLIGNDNKVNITAINSDKIMGNFELTFQEISSRNSQPDVLILKTATSHHKLNNVMSTPVFN